MRTSRLAKPLVALGAAALGLVVADVVLGVFLGGSDWDRKRLPPFGRHFPPAAVERLRGVALVAGVNVFDPELGWTNRPSKPTPKTGERINSIGARSRREYAALPPAGTRRVLCFGESFTFGSEVRDGDEWPAQLEALLADTEVLNFGVGAYGQDQALLRFRRTGTLGAEVVFLGIMLENIGRNVNRYRNRYAIDRVMPIVKPRFVLDGGELELVPSPYRTQRELFDAALAGRIPDDTLEHEYWSDDRPLVPGSTLAALHIADAALLRRRRVTRLWLDVAGEPFQVTLALLEAFHREALAAGAAEATILIFPSRSQLTRFARDATPMWATLHSELDRRGVPYIDLSEVLVEHHRSRTGPDGPELYLETHLSPFANARIAEHLAGRVAAVPVAR